MSKIRFEDQYRNLFVGRQALRVRIQALDECTEAILKLLEDPGKPMDRYTVEDALTVVHTVWLDVQSEVMAVRIELAILLRTLSTPEPQTNICGTKISPEIALSCPLKGVHSRSYTETCTEYTKGVEHP
jgi:hypothetical protein